MSDYYDRKGQPMKLMEWAKAFEKKDRIIGSTHVGDYHVSTIWLGVDHSFGGGPPLIFETMVFGPGAWNQYQLRYSTEDEALEGHKDLVNTIGTSNRLLDDNR